MTCDGALDPGTIELRLPELKRSDPVLGVWADDMLSTIEAVC